MVLRGHVKNGVVVLEGPKALPEGTEVSVRPLKGRRPSFKGKVRRGSLKPGLLRLSGKAKGLPADASQNVDQFLYGDTKR